MNIHRIRLAGPWQLVDASGSTSRVTLPVGLAQPSRLRRRFGRPRQLDSDERVWLVIEGLSGNAVVTLNDGPLESKAADATRSVVLRVDVTDRLVENNWLVIEWPVAESAALAGPVLLECATD